MRRPFIYAALLLLPMLSAPPARAQYGYPPGYYPPSYGRPPCGAIVPGPFAGAARGAAGGAIFGAIAGNAGSGAAIGAGIGGVAGIVRRGAARSNGYCY